MKPLFVTLLFSFFSLPSFCKGYTIIPDKPNYSKGDTISYTVYNPYSVCYAYPVTAYVSIWNSKLELAGTQTVKLTGAENRFQMLTSALVRGSYFITVESFQNAKPIEAMNGFVCIGFELTMEEMDLLNKPVVHLVPESGKALLNFTNRFLLSAKSLSGLPLEGKIYFKNQHNQLIALAKTNKWGKSIVDIPAMSGDTITVFDAKGRQVTKYILDNDNLFTAAGYAMHVYHEQDNLLVEMMKGQMAHDNKVIMEVYYREHLLAEATGEFRGDTAVVGTMVSAKNFSNRLLKIILKNEKKDILSERVYLLHSPENGENRAQVEGELFCNVVMPDQGCFSFNEKGDAVDLLIGARSLNGYTYTPDNWFSIMISNPQLKNQEIEYGIYGKDNTILQIGSFILDSTGVAQIDNCEFGGMGSIQFYKDKKPVNGFRLIQQNISPGLTNKVASVLASLPAIQSERLSDSTGIDPSAIKSDAFKNTKPDRAILIDRLEEKYVQNGMFKSRDGMQIMVEADSNARNYPVIDYLLRNIPGLIVKSNSLRFKMGYVEFYVDEMLVTDISMLNINDIGYIKSFNSPVSSGMSAQRGGAMLRGDSFAGGLQGSIAIYTKRQFAGSPKNLPKNGIIVQGYVN